ncbi:MAG TPA: hypothetical protein VFC69_09420 [Dysgonamonadaceae bacterium]|nr:hypothetical protein [Dysgonamonadaceae bacterium]
MTFKANSIRREEDNLIVGFELVPYNADIRINEKRTTLGSPSKIP